MENSANNTYDIILKSQPFTCIMCINYMCLKGLGFF